MQKKSLRIVINVVVFGVLIPLLLYLGITVFEDRKYYMISLLVVALSCIPFFVAFERRKPQPREMVTIAVMAAISVAGRCLFVATPGFKPVTAITAITGFTLGAEAGFLTGALSALVSNLFFGQGPWTPFQMFTWGMIGFIAGLLGKKPWMTKKIPLILFAIFAGIFFSFGMDIWGAISMYGVFEWQAYVAALMTAIPFTIVYIVSNIIFLLILTKPIMAKLTRLKVKYGWMQ